MINSVIQGDCIEIMRGMPDNSIDLICTDPPYFKVKSEWWDRQWDKPTEFLTWLDQVAEQWHRILKPNGSLYCFASPKMAARVEVMLGGRFCVLNQITWAKALAQYPPGDTRLAALKISDKEQARIFTSWSERILFCEHYGADNIAKGKAGYAAKCDELRGFVFEPLRAYLDGERQRARVSRKQLNYAFSEYTNKRGCRDRSVLEHYFGRAQWCLPTEDIYTNVLRAKCPGYFRREYEDLRREYEDLRREYEDLRRPFSVSADVPYTDVWTFPTVQHYPGKHSCEKPAAMLEHMITASTRPSAVVLDCFCGSGSTLVAAKKLGRQYIGIEIDPHWVSVSRQRLGDLDTKFIRLEDRVNWLESQVHANTARLKRVEKEYGQLSLHLFSNQQ